ncbi:hypothetical protein [Brevundimonas sp.]|uniref:hypothetical protein n=1 Tax=Brevundimonas sp. TaxID=1871086 RepID=UPI002D34A734|nr:hypothetical protein [Brevundimonas sp.]HYD26929.1 hypothetical protein [Brevundimonas sp.]
MALQHNITGHEASGPHVIVRQFPGARRLPAWAIHVLVALASGTLAFLLCKAGL